MTVHDLLTEVASCASGTIPDFLKARMTRRESSFNYSPEFIDLGIDARLENLKAQIPALVDAQGARHFCSV